LIAAASIVALTTLMVATVIRPRLAQLRSATTNVGGGSLLVVGLLIAVAALTPMAALGRTRTWKPVALSSGALVLGSALVLSFNERDGSDGLFMFPLLLGSILILLLSAVLTHRLRRRPNSAYLPLCAGVGYRVDATRITTTVRHIAPTSGTVLSLMPQDTASAVNQMTMISAITAGRFKASTAERMFSAASVFVGKRQASPRSRHLSSNLTLRCSHIQGRPDLPIWARSRAWGQRVGSGRSISLWAA
jgi:hypothetical protein